MNKKEPFEEYKYIWFSRYGAETDTANGVKVLFVYWNEKAKKQADELDYRNGFNLLCQILDNCNNNEARIVRIKRAIRNILHEWGEPPTVFNKPDYIEEAESSLRRAKYEAIEVVKSLCDDYNIKLDIDFVQQFGEWWQVLLLGVRNYDEVIKILQNN